MPSVLALYLEMFSKVFFSVWEVPLVFFFFHNCISATMYWYMQCASCVLCAGGTKMNALPPVPPLSSGRQTSKHRISMVVGQLWIGYCGYLIQHTGSGRKQRSEYTMKPSLTCEFSVCFLALKCSQNLNGLLHQGPVPSIYQVQLKENPYHQSSLCSIEVIEQNARCNCGKEKRWRQISVSWRSLTTYWMPDTLLGAGEHKDDKGTIAASKILFRMTPKVRIGSYF